MKSTNWTYTAVAVAAWIITGSVSGCQHAPDPVAAQQSKATQIQNVQQDQGIPPEAKSNIIAAMNGRAPAAGVSQNK